MELNQISRAFYLGYLWSLGRRFAMDRAMTMDAKRDLRDVRWVTINGTHVPISKKTGKIIGRLKDKIELSKNSISEYRKSVVTQDRAYDAYSHATKALKAQTPNYLKVVTTMAKELVGFVERNFTGVGYRRVSIDKQFVAHCRKFLTDGKNARSVAADLLTFAMSKLPDVISKGKESQQGWRHDKNHHPDREFLSVYKQYKRHGKNITVVYDLSRTHLQPQNDHRAHNVNATGISSYEYKRRALGIAKDSVEKIELWDISIR